MVRKRPRPAWEDADRGLDPTHFTTEGVRPMSKNKSSKKSTEVRTQIDYLP